MAKHNSSPISRRGSALAAGSGSPPSGPGGPTTTTNDNQLITLTQIENEPRVLDTDLAERLGFAEPRMIRKLIERHREALERFGSLFHRVTNPGRSGGRPALAFYLNQRQAVFLTTKSDAPNAIELSIQITEVFTRWLEGTLQPRKQHVIPQTYAEALRAAARAEEERELLEQKVAVLAPKADNWEKLCGTEGSITSTDLAKSLGLRSAKQLHGMLKEKDVIYPTRNSERGIEGWKVTAEYANEGLHRSPVIDIGRGILKVQLRWTPEGCRRIAQMLGLEPVGLPVAS